MGDSLSLADSFAPETSQESGSVVRPWAVSVRPGFPPSQPGTQPGTLPSTEPGLSAAAEKIRKEINQDNCEMTLPDEVEFMGNEGSQQIPLFTVTIQGDGCPIYLFMSLQPQVVETPGKVNMTAVMKYRYKIYSEELKAISDVIEMNLDGTVIADGDMPNGGSIGTGSFGMGVKMDFKGRGISQKYGAFTSSYLTDVKADIDMPNFPGVIGPSNNNNVDNGTIDIDLGQGMNFSMSTLKSHTVVFADVDALMEEEMKMEGFFSAKQEYRLNKEVVSREEYMKYTGYLKYPGQDEMVNPIDPGPPGERKKHIQCLVRVYDEALISAEDLKNSIDRGEQPGVAKLGLYNSCGPKRQAFRHQDKDYDLEFKYDSEFLTTSLMVRGGVEMPLELFVLEDEELDLIKPYQGLVVHKSCRPEVRCQ